MIFLFLPLKSLADVVFYQILPNDFRHFRKKAGKNISTALFNLVANIGLNIEWYICFVELY